MPEKINVAVVGATGFVGQRLVSLLEHHPFFNLQFLFASERSAGQKYKESLSNKELVEGLDFSPETLNLNVYSLKNIKDFKENIDLVFCAINLPKDEVKKIEEEIAKMEIVVVSNNSANRNTEDVPLIIPEINEDHLDIIKYQRERLGTRRGFIICKPNCSIQSYVPAIKALLQFKPQRITVATYQAISGAGKNFSSWPEMERNLIPYINGEEEKSENEPLKVLGYIEDKKIQPYNDLKISAQCYRVAVQDGHTAAVWVDFQKNLKLARLLKHGRNLRLVKHVSFCQAHLLIF